MSATGCNIRKNGTRNSGINTNGSDAIAAVLTSPGEPVANVALKVPMLTATMRSSIPNTFQRMNAALAANPG